MKTKGPPLSWATRITKKTSGGAVRQTKESHKRNTMSYIYAPFPTKIAHSQQVQKKIPTNIIVRFFYIQLAKHTQLPIFDSMKVFISNETKIKNLPSSNESVLTIGDNLLQNHFQPVS